MDDDLMNMLGLGGPAKETKSSAPALVVESSDGGAAKKPPASETALVVDEWDTARGEKLHAAQKKQFPDVKPADWTDLHAAAFNVQPELAEECVDPRRHEFVKGLLDSQEFQQLRENTVLNRMCSEMAAVESGKKLVELRKKDAERKKCMGQNPSDRKKEQAEADAAADMMSAVAGAVKEATQEVEEATEAARGLGVGGGNDGKIDPKQMAEVFRRVKQDPNLKRICQLAGRYRRVAQSRQRRKSVHGYDDTVGVELDNEVGRLLPVELARLADPELEDEVSRRLVERETMCRRFRGTEKVAKGPIVVVVDESGSMQGERIANAKAFALAMAWIAKTQGRWCALVGFSGDRRGTRLALPPRRWDQTKLCDWLTHFYGGGTVCDVPLEEVPFVYWKELGCPAGKTDMILVTDGLLHIPAHVRDRFNKWKEESKARCTTIIIGETKAGDLAGVSEDVHLVSSLTADGDAAAKCFSV
jgi:uncharacterized protein with von Willebrand factor type A (vWA) domain